MHWLNKKETKCPMFVSMLRVLVINSPQQQFIGLEVMIYVVVVAVEVVEVGDWGGLGLGVGISDMFYVVASISLLINKMFWQRYYNDRNTQKVHFDQWLLVSWIYISLVRKYRLNNNRNVSLQNAGDVMLLCEFFYFNLCCIFEKIKL